MGMYVLQITQVIYGFVFPKLVMANYGSSVNGLLSSITQFLSYIALMDAGVSAVIRSLLYRPLAFNDYSETQKIINSAQLFYRKIALFYLIYLGGVSIGLPLILAKEFNWIYTFSLVIIIGVSSFSEYYFGISYITLLDADQKKYIYCIIQSISILFNLLISVCLIKSGCSIHFVKFFSSAVYVIKPMIIAYYCKKKYRFHPQNNELEEIKNKWVGMANHIAYFLHTHIDIILLTLFKGAKVVSVYSVYNVIVMGLVSLISAATGGLEALFGNMNASHEGKQLEDSFYMSQFFVFFISATIFSTAFLVIMPFVQIYTRGISDANYYNEKLAILMILAEFFYCIRLPYQSIIVAVGKIKETMKGALIEVFINIVLSLLLVHRFGMIGVVFGTLCGMIFRTLDYAVFLTRHYFHGNLAKLFRQLIASFMAMILAAVASRFLPQYEISSYAIWVLMSIRAFFISLFATLVLNCIFFREDVYKLRVAIVKKWNGFN